MVFNEAPFAPFGLIDLDHLTDPETASRAITKPHWYCGHEMVAPATVVELGKPG